MRECPECGADVPEGGKFCPECGANVAETQGGTDTSRSRSATGGQPREQSMQSANQPAGERTRQAGEPPEAGQPGYASAPTRADTENHKLLFGSVVVLSVLGLLEGLGRVLSPEIFADELVQTATESGMEIEQALAEQVMMVSGGLGVIIGLAVAGLTIKNYRDNALQKRYFWLLVGTGVAGFVLASNLFLTLLVAFGIYGLVSVMD